MRKIFFVLISACILSSSYLVLGLANYIPLPASMNPNPMYPGAQEQQLPDVIVSNLDTLDPGLLQKIQNDFDIHICSTDDFATTCQWYLDEKKNNGWTLALSGSYNDSNNVSACSYFWKKGLMGNLLVVAEGKLIQEYYDFDVVFASAQGPLTSFYNYYNSYKYLFINKISYL